MCGRCFTQCLSLQPAPAAPKEKRASAAEGTASKEAASKSPPIQPGSNDAASRQAGGKESGSKGAPTCKGPAAKGVGEASPVSAEQPGPQQSAPAQGGKATDPAKVRGSFCSIPAVVADLSVSTCTSVLEVYPRARVPMFGSFFSLSGHESCLWSSV